MEYIFVYNSSRFPSSRFSIISTANFFKTDSIIINYDHEKMIFRVTNLDDYKPIKVSKLDKTRKGFKMFNEYLSTGKYEIDQDESNSDQVVIYYEDKL